MVEKYSKSLSFDDAVELYNKANGVTIHKVSEV
jgi:hypothetical protein